MDKECEIINGRIQNIEISIVIPMYNSKFENLVFTLDSLLSQEQLEFEIILVDDGSSCNNKKEIEKYFTEKNFKSWKAVFNKENQGTVLNIFSGMEFVRGKYLKIIAPGDAVYGSNSIRNWIDYNNIHNFEWSFSDIVAYKGKTTEIEYVSIQAYPNNIRPYLGNNLDEMRWNYIVLDEYAVGCSMLCRSYLVKEYLKLIKDRIIYAEDNIWRLMMFDGISAGYYPEPTVLYQYGTGVSTSNNDKWAKRLMKDYYTANEIMLEKQQFTDFQLKMIDALQKNKKGFFEKIFIRGKLHNHFLKSFFKRMTKIPLI